MLNKLTYIGKLMANSDQNNMCTQTLRNRKLTCKDKDLLTEYQTLCTELGITDIKDDCLDRKPIKTVIWLKNEQDIKLLVKRRPKIQNGYSDDKNERDYIQNLVYKTIECGLG